MQKYHYEKRDQTPNQASQLTQLNKLTVITVWQWRLTTAMLMKVEEFNCYISTYRISSNKHRRRLFNFKALTL